MRQQPLFLLVFCTEVDGGRRLCNTALRSSSTTIWYGERHSTTTMSTDASVRELFHTTAWNAVFINKSNPEWISKCKSWQPYSQLRRPRTCATEEDHALAIKADHKPKLSSSPWCLESWYLVTHARHSMKVPRLALQAVRCAWTARHRAHAKHAFIVLCSSIKSTSAYSKGARRQNANIAEEMHTLPLECASCISYARERALQ